MNLEEVKKEIAELVAQLNRLDRLYRDGEPEVSDAEFDRLMRRLKTLESEYPQFVSPDSPTTRVGSDLLDDFQLVAHTAPMQSIEDVFDEDELCAFDQRLRRAIAAETGEDAEAMKLEYCIEPKIDGAGISAIYEHGELVRVVTRGDGEFGNDITSNAFLIRNLPRKLQGDFPEFLDVRGECYMRVSEFERIREEQIQEWKAKQSAKFSSLDLSEGEGVSQSAPKIAGYANPRNLASGTMKLLPKSFRESPRLRERELLAVFYAIGSASAFEIEKQSALPDLFESWGLPRVDWFSTAIGIDTAREKIAEFETLRDKFEYNTDGAVVKLNPISLQNLAGRTGKAPRWAIAWKYPAEQKLTRLNSITLQVGRTGVVTPVAELEPVWLSGSRVARATLHNAGYIAQKDIRIGDFVLVEKAGEIIPAVVSVDFSKRPPEAVPYEFPETCPECGAKLQRFGEKMLFRCPDISCPPQVRERLAHFADRKCMDIDGLGGKLVEVLINKLGVCSPADIYALTPEKLISSSERLFIADKTGELSKTATNLLSAIEDSKKRPLWRLIFGLGIPEIGAQFAKELASRFGSLDALASADIEAIKAIEGFGSKAAKKDAEPVRAYSIRAFFDEPKNRELIERLRSFGVNFLGETSKGELPLSGKTFVFTGKLESMDRLKAEALLVELGAKCGSSVSKNTSYVVASPDAAGTKITKARELGLNIISEADFLKILEDCKVHSKSSAEPEQIESVPEEKSKITKSDDAQMTLF